MSVMNAVNALAVALVLKTELSSAVVDGDRPKTEKNTLRDAV